MLGVCAICGKRGTVEVCVWVYLLNVVNGDSRSVCLGVCAI